MLGIFILVIQGPIVGSILFIISRYIGTKIGFVDKTTKLMEYLKGYKKQYEIFIDVTLIVILRYINSCKIRCDKRRAKSYKKNSVIKKINAEYFTIGYGQSLYESKDKVKQETVDFLVKDYNKITFVGTAR